MGIIKFNNLINYLTIDHYNFYIYDILRLINTKVKLEGCNLIILNPDNTNISMNCLNYDLERKQYGIASTTTIAGLNLDSSNYLIIIKDKEEKIKSNIKYEDIEKICNNKFEKVILHSLEDNTELIFNLVDDCNFNYDLRNLYATTVEFFEIDDNNLIINTAHLW